MHRIHEQELPKYGFSRKFVGAQQGDVQVSAYLVEAAPGLGPRLHRHPYDKVAFVRAGRVRWEIDGQEHEAGPGDIVVVKAGEVHTFRSIGEEPLVQIDVHLSPTFIQENLD
jgi:quercetin dioxygenase-like cupin family protein